MFAAGYVGRILHDVPRRMVKPRPSHLWPLKPLPGKNERWQPCRPSFGLQHSDLVDPPKVTTG